MAKETFLIFQHKIPSIVAAFFHENEGYEYDIEGNDKKLIINVRQKGDEKSKLNGILTIYFSNGKTTFNPQGKLHHICEQCRDYIVKEATLADYIDVNRYFSFVNVTSEEFNMILDLVKGISDVTVKSVGGDSKVVNRSTVTGQYGNSVTITYYHTNTLTVQGLLTTLLLNVVANVTSCLDADKISKGDAYLQIFGEPAEPLLSTNLDDHLENRQVLAGTPYESLIISSISLVNSEIVLPEYSSLTHDALRALEGVIGRRLHLAENFTEEHPYIGSRFGKVTKADGSEVFELKPQHAAHITSSKTVAKLNEGYTFYADERHSLFHAHFKVVGMTRVINSKERATGIVLDTIQHIRAILRNW